ncbi:sugar ABC transporter permease, partial [Streptomyces albiflaviniger]|nr:sugar ABC transporter permease [Streptomyces albiflaviniger]
MRGAPRRLTRTEARGARAASGFLLPFLALFLLCFIAPIGYALYESLLKVERTGPLGLGGETKQVWAG